MITGTSTTGQKLVKHHGTDAIYFTGSAETGKKISQIASVKKLKKISLECSGKSCFIITKKCKSLKSCKNSIKIFSIIKVKFALHPQD